MPHKQRIAEMERSIKMLLVACREDQRLEDHPDIVPYLRAGWHILKSAPRIVEPGVLLKLARHANAQTDAVRKLSPDLNLDVLPLLIDGGGRPKPAPQTRVDGFAPIGEASAAFV